MRRLFIKPAEIDLQHVGLYEKAIQLLKLIHVDYHLASDELRHVSSRFSDREAIAARELGRILDILEDANGSGRKTGSAAGYQMSAGHHTGRPDSSLLVMGRAPSLEICCLGTLRVSLDSVPIQEWRSRKARSLLGLLLELPGRTAPKDVLMEALWPDCEPSLANNNLKSTARTLRQTLSSVADMDKAFSWLLFHDGHYTINPDGALWTDVDQFEYHWHVGRKLEKEGLLPEAMREYETAEALYHGDYLEDNLYEEWTSLRREALKDVYLSILLRLADRAIQQAEYETCIDYCQKILLRDRCREDAYQRLMSCHSRLGQRSRAISWYHICEKTMKEELDVCPEPQTVQLHQDLLKGKRI